MKKRKCTRLLSQEELEQISNILMQNRYIIQRHIMLILGSELKDLLDDCISDISLAAFRSGSELIDHPNVVGWLIRTSKNCAFNAKRKYFLENHLPYDQVGEKPSDLNVFEDVIFSDWMNKGVKEELLSRLAPREQEVYRMLFVEHMSISAVAESLHVKESTVRNIKKHLMDKIKKDIKEHNFKGL